jgi:hypothetical protein
MRLNPRHCSSLSQNRFLLINPSPNTNQYRIVGAEGLMSSNPSVRSARDFPSEVAEMALAHAVADKVEAAYRGGDLRENRRQLMDEGSLSCGTLPTHTRKLIPIHRW